MTHEESSHVTCHACGARFDRKAWSMLALVERIEPNEVKRMLVDWPNEHCIEIRRCRRCAREVPAKRDAIVVERRRATASHAGAAAARCIRDHAAKSGA
jgi:hypothetical protein